MAVAGTVGDALAAAADALRAAGVETPRLDAEVLLAAAIGRDRAALATAPEAGVEAAAARSFGAMVRRRVAREPVAYIIGNKGFRRIELRCDGRALIPRPESELLVEVALELEPASALDVGTGSGAIALAIADEMPNCALAAVDTSAAALALARENAAALGLEGRVTFEQGPLPRRSEFDLVVANLPYVREDEWRRLQPEITRWEPREALASGADGLDAIRMLLAELRPGGALRADAVALEIGAEQGEAVAALTRAAGFDSVAVRQDLAGFDRAVVGQMSSRVAASGSPISEAAVEGGGRPVSEPRAPSAPGEATARGAPESALRVPWEATLRPLARGSGL